MSYRLSKSVHGQRTKRSANPVQAAATRLHRDSRRFRNGMRMGHRACSNVDFDFAWDSCELNKHLNRRRLVVKHPWISRVFALPPGLAAPMDHQMPTPWHSTSASDVGALLPTAAECLIELDHAEQLIQADLRKRKLRLKQVAIRVQSIEQGIDAAFVADVGKPLAIAERRHQRFLFDAALA